MTAKEVAHAIGAAESTYRAWEAGRAIQGEEPYVALARVFQIPLHELLTGQPSQNDDLRAALEGTEREFNRLKTALSRVM
jgi:transcriptional regulator with XRE-family HTH domain